MRSLGIALIGAGAAYLIAVAAWTGGFVPFTRRAAVRRGESYDHERGSGLRGWHLLASIAAVLVGLGLVASH